MRRNPQDDPSDATQQNRRRPEQAPRDRAGRQPTGQPPGDQPPQMGGQQPPGQVGQSPGGVPPGRQQPRPAPQQGQPPTQMAQGGSRQRGGQPQGRMAGQAPQGGQQPPGAPVQQTQPPVGQPPQQHGQPPGATPPAGGSGQEQTGVAGVRPRLRPAAIEEIVRTDVVTAEPDTPVATVIATMAEENVGSVVVVEDDAPVGIVTDRGITLALEEMPDLNERRVEEIMAEDLVTATTDATVFDVIHTLDDAGVRRLPVVDEDGRLAGIVTLDDVLVTLTAELGNAADVLRTQMPRL